MKKLLEKIRKMLRDRRTRQILTRIVSITAAIVVFSTTYALVLPAITMEVEADCGIEAHQHDDSCYEDVLVCGIPESEGHQHDDSCYSVSSVLACGIEEHQHDESCFDESGELVCSLMEHTHNENCMEEIRELICGLEESEGHTHDSSCYEKVLVCGKEVHIHSEACYHHADEEEELAVMAATGVETAYGASTQSASVFDVEDEELEVEEESAGAGDDDTEDAGTGEYGGGNTGAVAEDASSADGNDDGPENTDVIRDVDSDTLQADPGSTAAGAAGDVYVPTLAPVSFDRILNRETGIYYYHVDEGEVIENSSTITDWQKVSRDTELGRNDLLRVYLAYTVPAGKLNATNDVARYRMPSNLNLTDEQVKAINENENGVAAQYIDHDSLTVTDPDNYHKYLGAEAIEGTRRPSDEIDRYLSGHGGEEYISAVVRVEDVYDVEGEYGKKGAYLGQELVFTFVPYSVQKNQNEYDSTGELTKAGGKISGWLTLDFNVEQVDWNEPVVTTEEAEDETLVERSEQTAEVVFVSEDRKNDIDEISTDLTMVTETVKDSAEDSEEDAVNQDAADAEGAEETAEKDADAASDAETASGSVMPAMSFTDSIRVSTGKPASTEGGGVSYAVDTAADSLPKKAEVTVRVEADEGTFPAGTTMVLSAVEDMDAVAESVKEAVEKDGGDDSASDPDAGNNNNNSSSSNNNKNKNKNNSNEKSNPTAYGFQAVDISFYDVDGNEIEPAKPVRVALTSEVVEQVRKEIQDNEKTSLADPVVVHIDNDGNAGQMDLVAPEEIEPAQGRTEEELLKEQEKQEAGDSTVFIESDSFSVYAIVYTVEFHADYITASGEQYEITVEYGSDAKIPEDAELRVREIKEDEQTYSVLQNDAAGNLEGADQIPSHPVLLDISIWAGDREIEPADGSEVKVEIKLVRSALKGMYTDEDSPLLVNDAPVTAEIMGETERAVQVVHQVEEGRLEVMETTDTISDEEVVSQFVTGSFSNWLLYLDEDLTDINVTTSDSVTLRPYTEWVWKSGDELPAYQGGEWSFPTSDWNVTEQDENIQTGTDWWGRPIYETIHFTYYTHKTNGSVFRSFSKTDGELNETYTVVTSVSLSATNGGFDLQTNKGKTIHVHVTQGNSSPKPPTVNGISGLTVNLFDYDVPTGANGQGYDFTRSGDLDDSGNTANTPNNTSTNSPPNDDGRDFKILGWGASDASSDREWYWINDYTHDDANQGIVKRELGSDGYPELEVTPENHWPHGNASLDYLFDPSSKSHSVYAFPNADGLFQLDNQGYYYYNSNTNYAEYDQANNKFILYSHTYSQNTGGSNGANAKPIGFFPFHEYDTANTQTGMNHNKNLNHHFGMSMTVDFEIPKDRKMEDGGGNKHDIIYEFSGDDDLWVFVDNELALDIGGIHQPVTGSINFTTGVIKVHGKEDITMNFDVGGHELKMFYIERGGCDSNLSVRFNLPLTIGNGTIHVIKKSAPDGTATGDQVLEGAQFGIWENPDCSGDPYKTAFSDEDGVVDFGELPIRVEGQRYYMKEIKAPDGYLTSQTIYTLVAGDKDSNGKYVFTTFNGEQNLGQNPVIPNKKPEPIDLSVHKDWEDAAGNTIQAPGAKGVFELKRYKTYLKEIPQDPIESDEVTLRAGRVNYNTWRTTDVVLGKFKRGTTATVTWNYPNSYSGNRQYRSSTNGGDSGGSWQYSAQNLNRSGSMTITIPTDDRYEAWVYFYDTGSNVTLSATGTPATIEQDPLEELTTELDNFSQTIELPKDNGSNDHTFPNLPVQVIDSQNNKVYDYTYFIVETPPAGYEAVYLDGDDHPIADPTALATNEDGLQKVINRQLLNIPIEKFWPDFSGDQYTWTATFQLQEMEKKVNEEDPDDAPANVHSEFVDVPGKTLTVTKDQSPVPTFDGLPMYRVHSNGTVYRIVYSVDEIAYEVKSTEDGSVIASWVRNGATVGDKYTPQFDQDAGENGDAVDDYEIIVVNTPEDLVESREIDLGIRKEWPAGTIDPDDSTQFARFVLKRYVHQEHRDYSNTPAGDEYWATVTLRTSTQAQEEGNRLQTMRVPKNTVMHIVGNIKGSVNANRISLTRSTGGSPLELILDNSNSTSPAPFDITFTADADMIVDLTGGDNYVVGGRDGFRLSDTYGDKTADVIDPDFEEEFVLNNADGWTKLFERLPLVQEDDPETHGTVQTLYVYSYFLEELGSNPDGFEASFKDTNGNILGDESYRIGFSTDFIAQNDLKKGSLKITKNITVNGDPVSAGDSNKNLADGTYVFIIRQGGTPVSEGTVNDSPVTDGRVEITITDGEAETVEVKDLTPGEYTITEETPENGTALSKVGNTTITDQSPESDKVATVTVLPGKTGNAEGVPTASFTNNIDTGFVRLHKVVQYDGHDPANASQRQELAGDYIFHIFSNETLTEQVGTFTITIGSDGAAQYSDPIELPVGDYWIEEEPIAGKPIYPLEDNPRRVEVTAADTSDQPLEFTVTNDYYVNSNEDTKTIDIEKRFEGLEEADIPAGFQMVLQYTLNGVTKEIVLHKNLYGLQQDGIVATFEKDTAGTKWVWHLMDIPTEADGFKVKEVNYEKSGYDRSSFRLERTQQSSAEVALADPGAYINVNMEGPEHAEMTEVTDTKRYTADNDTSFWIDEGTVLLVALTSNKGTAAISLTSLNNIEREAISNNIPLPQGSFAQPVKFYSLEQHQNSISPDNNRRITVQDVNGRKYVTVPKSGSSQEAVFEVTYYGQTTFNNEVFINRYSEDTEIDIVKVTRDSLDQETKEPLAGAVFQITQLNEASTAAHVFYLTRTEGGQEELVYQSTSEETGDDGRTAFTQLSTGYYEILETQAPDGYIFMKEPVYVRINHGVVTCLKKPDVETAGETTIQNWETVTTGNDLRFQPVDTDNETATLTIGNTPGAALPHTGGPGTRLLYLLGTMLTLFGAGILLRRPRRQ